MGVSGRLVPLNYVKIFVFSISTDIKKKWHLSLNHSKNWFLEPNFGKIPKGVAPKIWETKLRLQLNTFAQKLGFDVSWFRERGAYKV